MLLLEKLPKDSYYYEWTLCWGGGIRTHSAKAPDLQSDPTLQRWRTPMLR